MTDPTTVDHELIRLVGSRFLERRDVRSEQSSDGAYYPVRQHRPRCDKRGCDCPPLAWKGSDIRDHLEGRRSYGHYLVSAEQKCRVMVFDIDLTKQGTLRRLTDSRGWVDQEITPRAAWADDGSTSEYVKTRLTLDMRVLADVLARQTTETLGIPTAVAYSGCKGLHVYGFVGSTPAVDVRAGAQEVMASLAGDGFQKVRGDNFFAVKDFDCFEVEVFPKQDEISKADGLGNLVRLPLGIHRRSGSRGFFVDVTQPLHLLQPDNPHLALEHGSYR